MLMTALKFSIVGYLMFRMYTAGIHWATMLGVQFWWMYP